MAESKMKYEMHINSVYNLDGTKKTKSTRIITQEQFDMILMVADTKKDPYLDTTYVINKLELKIYPYVEPLAEKKITEFNNNNK